MNSVNLLLCLIVAVNKTLTLSPWKHLVPDNRKCIYVKVFVVASDLCWSMIRLGLGV